VISSFLQRSVEGIGLKCGYNQLLQNNFKICEVEKVDLSNIFREENFEISGSTEELSETNGIEFRESPHVDFIPPAVVERFPNLIAIVVDSSIVPIIKNDLFSSKFDKIKGLSIVRSNIEFIEEKAFQHLKILEEINFTDNKIKRSKCALFSNNPKLMQIDLRLNEITIILPKLFKNLYQLKEVKLEDNECIDEDFGTHKKFNYNRGVK
jgi:hypothetical protein